MQFITENPEHIAVSSGTKPLYDLSGNMVNPGTRRIHAKFRRGLPGWVLPQAREVLDFNLAKPEVPPEQWFSFYDSVEAQAQNGWTDEERETIEQDLSARGFCIVEMPSPELPYKAYLRHRKITGKRTLQHAVSDIKGTLEQMGDDLEKVFAYENFHRDSDTDALLAALAPEKEPEEELVEA